MSDTRSGSVRTVGIPSQDGLRLILAGVVYLLAICLLQAVALLGSLMPGTLALAPNLMDNRDVVALFGWVGFMISGVSVIIIPNHLRVRLRPRHLPTLHLLVANIGLIGFFTGSIVFPNDWLAGAGLGAVSLSFFVFGLGVIRTIVPFLDRRRELELPTNLPLSRADSH